MTQQFLNWRKLLLICRTFKIGLILVAASIYSFGQSDQVSRMMPKPMPQSPTAAALGKFGDYPVSYFTGLPDISIAIFEAKSGNLKAPITLSYHASGIRYTEQASWVGLGWSLSAGGQLSRSIAGKPDEELFYAGQMVQNPTICDNYEYIKGVALGSNDTAPDLFSYSFPGKSGKFYLRQGGLSPYLIPYEPLVVTPFPTTGGVFEITDESGNLYRYGKNAAGTTSIESTNSTNGGVGSTANTSWLLMEMVAPNSNNMISFNYQPNGNPVVEDVTYQLSVNDLCTSTGMICPQSNMVPQVLNSYSMVNQQALSSILFEGGKVEFLLGGSQNRDDQASKYLDQINIYSEVSGAYSLVKSVKFQYTYFKNSTNNVNLRLKLDAVSMLDKNGVVTEKYNFTYYTNNFSWDLAINSLNRDYWGFYNGRNNTDLIPSQQISYQSSSSGGGTTIPIGGAIRDPDTTFVREAILKRIDFPTGGYTQFEFEPHQYEDNGPKFGGGLRIKKITSSDGISASPVIKTYKYGATESGSGQKNFNWSKYFYNSQITSRIDAGPPDGNSSAIWRSRVFFSNSLLSPDAYDGSPVVYPYVSEYIGDAAGNNIGKIRYTFDGGGPVQDGIQFSPPMEKNYVNILFWQRGKMTSKTIYDGSGNKVTESVISYSLLHSTPAEIVGLLAEKEIDFTDITTSGGPGTCTNDPSVYIAEYNFMSYYQSSGAYRQTSSVETQYDYGNQNRMIAKTTTSQIDDTYLQPTQSSQSSSNSSGDVAVTKTRYPFSYTYTGSETGNAKGLKVLKDRNVLSQPIEQYTIRSDGSNNRVTGGQVTTFKENPLNTSQIVTDQIYLLESPTTIQEGSYTLTGITSSAVTMDSRYKPRINFTSDGTGNISEVSKTNDKITSYLWGYSQHFPIAEVQNSDLARTIVSHPYANTVILTATTSGDVTMSTSFTLPYAQTVSGTVVLTMLGTGGPNPPNFTVKLKDSNGTQWSINNYTYGTANVTFSNLPAGTYSYVYNAIVVPSGGFTGIKLDVTATWVSTTQKAFFTSFEDEGTVNALAYTGKKVGAGPYTLPINTYGASCVLSYWKKTGSNPWTLVQSTTSSTSITIGASGDLLDEVRLYPVGSTITTYTYEPALGITCATDVNNIRSFYDYDTFGRLQDIKDDKGKILKSYQYNYKGPN